MNGDRLTRIEGQLATIEAEQRAHLRWMLIIAISLASLFVAGFGLTMTRIDRTEDRISRVEDRISRVETAVAELPGRISENLTQLNQTLLQAITAANSQRPPQVIIVPQGQTSPSLAGRLARYRKLAQNLWMRSQACSTAEVAVA